MSGFRGPHQMTNAIGCKLCRAPLPEFSNVVYFVNDLFVADVAVMVLTSLVCGRKEYVILASPKR